MTNFIIPNPPKGVSVDISVKIGDNTNILKLLSISFNLADTETRNLIHCLYKNLQHYNAYAGYDDKVLVKPDTLSIIDKILKGPK